MNRPRRSLSSACVVPVVSIWERLALDARHARSLLLLAVIAMNHMATFAVAAEPSKSSGKDSVKELTNSIGMKLVSIPAGEFVMGTSDDEIARQKEARKKTYEAKLAANPETKDTTYETNIILAESEGPQHNVTVKRPFYLGVYEVTQQEFSTVMGYNPSAFSAKHWKKEAVAGLDTSRFPVEAVSWEDAVEFCQQLSTLPEEVAAGRTYRLPTEAEWEYACRAGTTTEWHWGNNSGKEGITATEYAWTVKVAGDRTHPVGEKKPNPWGLYDMAGNVAEWCADWYGATTYASSTASDPTGSEFGTERVMRGGGYGQSPWQMRSAFRAKCPPGTSRPSIGMRVVCLVSPKIPAKTTGDSAAALKTTGTESSLPKKGLVRQGVFFVLPQDSQFVRFTGALARLRVACFTAQKEIDDVQRRLESVQSAKVAAINSRTQARNRAAYSSTWREHWQSVQATKSADDAIKLVDLSKEDLEAWKKDARQDFDDAVSAFGQQCSDLRKMYEKLQTDMTKLGDDRDVKQELAQANTGSKTTYRLGPSADAVAAAKKLAQEESVFQQLKKK